MLTTQWLPCVWVDWYDLYHGHQGFIAENHPIPRAQLKGRGVVFRNKSIVTVVEVLYILYLIGPTKSTLPRVCNLHSSVDGVFHE